MESNPLSNVSLVVITFNEAANIGRCLASAAGVGEMVVVDSFSTDGTPELARQAGATVYQRPFISAADQKNWAIGQATGEWVLVLDAEPHSGDEWPAECPPNRESHLPASEPGTHPHAQLSATSPPQPKTLAIRS